MIKKIILNCVKVIIVLLVIYFIYALSSGFKKQDGVFISEFEQIENDTKLKINVGLISSIGFVRKTKTKVEDNKMYIDFYSAFGGINGRIGARNTFIIDMSEAINVDEIYLLQNGNYSLKLKKNEQGKFERIVSNLQIVSHSEETEENETIFELPIEEN